MSKFAQTLATYRQILEQGIIEQPQQNQLGGADPMAGGAPATGADPMAAMTGGAPDSGGGGTAPQTTKYATSGLTAMISSLVESINEDKRKNIKEDATKQKIISEIKTIANIESQTNEGDIKRIFNSIRTLLLDSATIDKIEETKNKHSQEIKKKLKDGSIKSFVSTQDIDYIKKLTKYLYIVATVSIDLPLPDLAVGLTKSAGEILPENALKIFEEDIQPKLNELVPRLTVGDE